MSNAAKAILAVLLTTLFLSACGEYRRCSPGDSIDLVELEEAAKWNKVEEVWGKPVRTVETNDGWFDAYSFMSDRGCILVVWALFPYPIPTDLPSTGYFTIAYDATGSFKSVQVWRNAVSPGKAIEMHAKSSNQKQKCESAFAEAANPDAVSLLELQSECWTAFGPETRMILTCLLAHHEDARSQYEFGKAYDTGYAPGSTYGPTKPILTKDPRQAYVWYRLAEIGGYEEYESRCFYSSDGLWTCKSPNRQEVVASELTEEELEAVENLAANWVPNPTECRYLPIGKANP